MGKLDWDFLGMGCMVVVGELICWLISDVHFLGDSITF